MIERGSYMADPQRPGPAGPVPAGPSGYVIRPPQPGTPAPAMPPPAQATATAAPIPVRPPELVAGLTQNGAVIGAAVMVVAAIVIFLLRGAVRSHLIANRSSVGASAGAFCGRSGGKSVSPIGNRTWRDCHTTGRAMRSSLTTSGV